MLTWLHKHFLYVQRKTLTQSDSAQYNHHILLAKRPSCYKDSKLDGPPFLTVRISVWQMYYKKPNKDKNRQERAKAYKIQ